VSARHPPWAPGVGAPPGQPPRARRPPWATPRARGRVAPRPPAPRGGWRLARPPPWPGGASPARPRGRVAPRPPPWVAAPMASSPPPRLHQGHCTPTFHLLSSPSRQMAGPCCPPHPQTILSCRPSFPGFADPHNSHHTRWKVGAGRGWHACAGRGPLVTGRAARQSSACAPCQDSSMRACRHMLRRRRPPL
jgi:hypothetical protein